MSEQTGTTTDTSASSESAGSTNTQDAMVPKSELDRVLKDMHKYKATAKELESKVKTSEEQKLKEQEDWKEYAEIKEKEAQEAIQASDRLRESYVNEKKFSAIREAAMKAGIHQNAVSDLELLSLDSVVLEMTSTGKSNVLGADQFVSSLKTLKPHWFTSVKTNVNSSIPGVQSSEPITAAQLVKASKDAEKSGDYTAYQNLNRQYQQQQRR